MANDGQLTPSALNVPSHKLLITVFPNNLAQRKETVLLSLSELAHRMQATSARTKDKLPLLKLAEFGDVVSTKKCLRTNANMMNISGIEVEHDTGRITVKQAEKILRDAGVLALLYTTPSHVPIERERWRALLPTSGLLPKTERFKLVARVNGLFAGGLAPESFAMSQAFYFGNVEGGEVMRLRTLEGDFIDLCDDLDAGARMPAPKGGVTPPTGGQSYDLPDLDKMIAAVRDSGEGWHNTMLTLTASYVARGWTDEAIGHKCRPILFRDDDPTFVEMLRSARDKFGRKPVPAGLKAILAPSTGANSGQLAPVQNAQTVQTVQAPARPADDAPLADKVAWLLETHGYDQREDRVVVLYGHDQTCRIKTNAFREEYAAWFTVQAGPRGGQVKQLATAGWQINPNRLSIAGVRMAPDRAFPVYQEEGAWFKNTYQRPVHAAGVAGQGEVTAFLDFLARLVPEQASREHLLDWMAHKWRFPETPGTACLFVADNDQEEEGAREGSFGTGRGILFSIARGLYGRAYCAEQDFRVLDGSSGQSIYTDWLHDRVLVTCDESPSSPTHYRRSERALAYETIKRVIDPAITDRTFTAKYRQAFAGRSHCSIWIATNHIDALAIPAGDRRITVYRNGRQPTRAEIAEIVAWRAAPGSLAALAAFLEARDISAFDMHSALMTKAKQDMVAAGHTPVEETFLELMDDLSRGRVFTRDDLQAAVYSQHNQGGIVSGHFEEAWRRHVAKALRPDGAQKRLRVGTTQKKLFCFRRNARLVEGLGEEDTREEALRWKPGFGSHGAR